MTNTAAESTWQNESYKKNDAVVDCFLQQILQDSPRVPLPTTLLWTLNAKKIFVNVMYVFIISINVY